MRNVVGILLDRKTYLGIQSKQTGYEQIDLYNQAAEKLGIHPFYMCLQHTSGNSVLGLCFENKRYRLIRLPIPKVIHNRAMSLSPLLHRNLNLLASSSRVFNRRNRYDKLFIHKLLHTKESLRIHLPTTLAYSRKHMLEAMGRFSDFFVKPTNSSLGEGIIKLSKQDHETWRLFWSNHQPRVVSRDKALAFIQEKVGNQCYLIQQAIMLATYRNRPYDLRVSVQRGDKGIWQVSGIAGKVAAHNRQVTNLGKGGEAKRCEELFRESGFQPDLMKEAIDKVSLRIAEYLGKRLPEMADVGLDVGVDLLGHIWLIEVNGRDQRYEFKKLNMEDTFYRTYETPLVYAKYLLNK
ncbi:YheC/YheD family protein [Paenibacillus aceris]|uniref:Glutathione synthase/RimK-type ligase-like ATP-grasp enzyme n=1 Tax=Paenibacillus aceris TaxID=869555 RepID=A0ABS4I0C7_9BACL|nr:glutathione synthase/RimK-type ligase-like ATP-grasp enzyme [Paenibacillus aceris]NHW35917.1 YheC/YheD family protein [Paenibacillus aceris]